MTAPTIEQKLNELLAKWKADIESASLLNKKDLRPDRFFANLESALSQPAQAGVAVAWIAAAGNGYEKHIVDDPTRLHQLVCELKGNGWEDVTVTPLYTTPEPHHD